MQNGIKIAKTYDEKKHLKKAEFCGNIRNIHATSKSFTALLVFVIATFLVANIFFKYI